jgi:glycosyltransferase involved in cell wall biosynthesis
VRIVYIVNAHSTISRSWIGYFIERGHDVHVISSYPCRADALPGAKVYQFPVAFSGFSRINQNGTVASTKERSLLTMGIASLRTGALSGLAMAVRFWLGPLELQRYVQKARQLITQLSPDIVHAMRIPFEGILAAKAAPAEMPLLISIWGNDLTLFANYNPIIARQTAQTLKRTDALHCDCHRDFSLATREWNFNSEKPATILPGAGGIQTSLFHSGEADLMLRSQLNIPDDVPVIINPRGFRAYVRNDAFFLAIPRILRKSPKAVFICSSMQGNPVAKKWVRRLAIEDSVRLLPAVPRERMADLFRLASISVSPSFHDGTPNTLLEAMACGCFPIAGDIESVREWITDGVNGLLCDPTDPESLALAITRALGDIGMRNTAREHNVRLIAERAEYGKVMQQAEEFYFRIIERKQAGARV